MKRRGLALSERTAGCLLRERRRNRKPSCSVKPAGTERCLPTRRSGFDLPPPHTTTDSAPIDGRACAVGLFLEEGLSTSDCAGSGLDYKFCFGGSHWSCVMALPPDLLIILVAARTHS